MSASGLKKISLRLERSSLEKLRRIYPTLPYNKTIRAIINQHIKLAEARMPKIAEDLDIEIPDELMKEVDNDIT